jgi:hypothetical protein
MKNFNKIYIIPILLCIGLVGCLVKKQPTTNTASPSPLIKTNDGKIRDKNNQNQSAIDELDEYIKEYWQSLAEVQKKRLADTKPKADQDIKTIKDNTEAIADILNIIDGLTVQVDMIVNERDGWHRSSDQEHKNYLEEVEKNKSGIKKIVLGIAGISFLCVIGSGVLGYITRDKIWLFIGIGFGAITGVCIVFDKYYDYIVDGFAIAIAVGLAIGVYKVIKYINQHNSYQDTSIKLVQLGELLKHKLSDLGEDGEKLREEIFGSGPGDHGIAGNILDGVKDQVSKIRASGTVQLATKKR